jgi:hypothetical protein
LRVAEFRVDYPIKDGWGIVTDAAFDGDLVRVTAYICDPTDRIIATGIAEEKRGSSQINRTSALENCETSAIGRALAAAGYGGSEYASANEVENAIQQQRTVEVIPGDAPPSVDLEAIVVNSLSQPPSATNQARFEMAVVELVNRGAAALSVTNEISDPYAEMQTRLAHTLGAHGVESAAELTVRAKQLKFYHDLEETVTGLEATAEEVATAGL